MNKDGQLFSETWQESQSWFQYEESTCDFFNDKAAKLNLQSIETFLSIGPGAGTIEKRIIETCMPSLKTFTAVEPTDELLTQLKDHFRTSLPNIQVLCINETMQAFQGPENPVQLILICHSIYYMTDNLEHQISRALQWLTPDGALIIIVGLEYENSFMGELRKAVYWADLSISSIHVKEAMEKMKLEFEEHHVAMPVNANSTRGKEEVFAIALNRKCTKEEVRIMSEVLDKYWNRETGDIGMEQAVFVVRKTTT